MNPSTRQWIRSVAGEHPIGDAELVQELWSGFGRISRVRLSAGPAILKAVDPGPAGHPRGWVSERSNARKLRSYRVERQFYAEFAARLAGIARVPCLLGARETETGGEMLLEDLDHAGFAGRRDTPSDAEVQACVRWLARFHGAFLGSPTTGLWERGSYWHLATRPDELAAVADPRLREGAAAIDARLGEARHRSLVHGDAKVANFCFRDGDVAALDFQYVGGGIGVQDLSYFLGSCLVDQELEEKAELFLDGYFEALAESVGPEVDSAAVEAEWRELWPYAWADFHRFLAGWAPGHWKLSRYSDGMLERALK